MSAGGFCQTHQRYLNEFGWCDECGEPVTELRPPLPLSQSVLDVTNGFAVDDEGRIIPERYVRACGSYFHIFGEVPGHCQCGEKWWDGPSQP